MNTPRRARNLALTAAALAALPTVACATLPTASGTAINLAESGYTLWIPSSYQPRGNVADLMVFYHGDPATVRNNLEYSNLNTILVTVNLGGFSSSYQTPYQGHPELFPNIVAETKTLTRNYFANQNLNWDKVGVSTFSAGWAAMREIIKDPTNYNTISSYAALDTIYASFTNGTADETPLASDMVNFKKLALDAKNGNKTMVLNHTQVQTYTYANTQQTADDINNSLGLTPVSYTTPGLGNATHDMSFYRSTSSGNYLMYGMTGDDANTHSVNLQESGQFFTETAYNARDFSIGNGVTYNFDVGLAAGLQYTGTTSGSTITGQVQIPRREGDHTLNVANGSAASDLTISNRIFGLGTMVKAGAGTLTLTGSTANTSSGLTRVDAGVLEFNKTAGVASVAGNLTVQNGGTARWLQSNQVADTAMLTLAGGTTVADLNGKSDTVASLAMNWSTVSLGAGSLNVTGQVSTTTAFGTPLVSGSGTLTAASLDAQGGLTRTGGGVTKLTGATLNIGSSRKLDLTDTRLITKMAAGTFNGFFYFGVSRLVQVGRNGGAWNGAGRMITSMTAANAANGLTTLAVADNSVLGKTTFGGQSVDATDTLVMYTYAGDMNLDGRITGDDYFRIDAGYAAHTFGYINGDLNYDGKINADDYFIIDHNYNDQTGVFASGDLPPEGVTAASTSSAQAVPEPAAAAFLAVAAAGSALRRRARRSSDR